MLEERIEEIKNKALQEYGEAWNRQNHFYDVTGNILFMIKYLEDPSLISKGKDSIREARQYRDDLLKYLDLVEQHDIFRYGEFTCCRGHFRDLAKAQIPDYIKISAERLQSGQNLTSPNSPKPEAPSHYPQRKQDFH